MRGFSGQDTECRVEKGKVTGFVYRKASRTFAGTGAVFALQKRRDADTQGCKCANKMKADHSPAGPVRLPVQRTNARRSAAVHRVVCCACGMLPGARKMPPPTTVSPS